MRGRSVLNTAHQAAMKQAMPIHPYPTRAKTPVTWPARVDAAGSAHDVVEIARDFLAQFTPYEIHALPEPCKPPVKIVDADDVSAYAFALVRHECEEGAEHAELVHKMADFFAHASRRLAHLASHADRAAEDVPRRA